MKTLKKITFILLAILLIFGGTACTGQQNNAQVPAETTYPLTITDDFGNEVTFDEAPEKIISVAPSNTEVLFALGLGEKVVGVTEYCNYPEEATTKEKVGGYAGPNTEAILDLEPDVVFGEFIPDDVKLLLEGAGVKVFGLSAVSIEDVYNNINTIGQVTNTNENSQKIIDQMKEKKQEVIDTISQVEKKSVFVDIGGFYSAGPNSFMNDMLSIINVENIAGDAETAWPQLNIEQIIEKNPQVYISLYTSAEDIKAIEGFQAIDAVANDNIYVLPFGTVENDIIQRPGPRCIDGLEVLAKTIYPEAFQE